VQLVIEVREQLQQIVGDVLSVLTENRNEHHLVGAVRGLSIEIRLNWRRSSPRFQHEGAFIRQNLYQPAALAQIPTIPSNEPTQSLHEAGIVQVVSLDMHGKIATTADLGVQGEKLQRSSFSREIAELMEGYCFLTPR